MNTSYATDLSLWAQQTADLLREKRWQDIDLEHLVEELEDLSKSEKRGISSQLVRLLLHLLKWEYQPQRRSDSWLDSITDSRLQIELAIKDSPSLKNYPLLELTQAYQRARWTAAKQTHLPLSTFPETCPHTLDKILAEDWLPE
ncbi:MAG: DUF29 domain-containing protein [Candidatus Competibacter sp.]